MRQETYRQGCTLTIKISDGREVVLEEFIEPGREYTIGSHPACDVVVSPAHIVHATLRCIDRHWWVFYIAGTGIKHGVDRDETHGYRAGCMGQSPSPQLPPEQHAFELFPGNCVVIEDTVLEVDYEKGTPYLSNDLPVTTSR
jgi:hypothetical protein